MQQRWPPSSLSSATSLCAPCTAPRRARSSLRWLETVQRQMWRSQGPQMSQDGSSNLYGGEICCSCMGAVSRGSSDLLHCSVCRLMAEIVSREVEVCGRGASHLRSMSGEAGSRRLQNTGGECSRAGLPDALELLTTADVLQSIW